MVNGRSQRAVELKRIRLAGQVEQAVMRTPVHDIHTHLYDAAFKELLLSGIDELLVYHYLVAEAFRHLTLPYDQFHCLSKPRQAELIWDQLFIRHSPVSEACRGVLTVLNRLGLDVRKRDLASLRKWFAAQSPERHLTRCLDLAGARRICMTNSPFDPVERAVWERGFRRDERFTAALRIDPLILDWAGASKQLREQGYNEGRRFGVKSGGGGRRFLEDWTRRMKARYVMVSLPPEFAWPADSESARVIERVVLPHCRDAGLPLALMLGVRRAVNPALGLAGDGCGRGDLTALQNLCAAFPDNRFLATVLSRENQHELCVLARKFRNLHVFGCWWFTNVPVLIEEITRLRLELIGLSVTPQHSDARVLEQLIYKWDHTRRILARVLADRYGGLLETGWEPSTAEIERDVADLLGGAFERFCAG